jgi:hypothetical protein
VSVSFQESFDPDAFIFGVHFAALALMKSLLETTVKMHYHSTGKNLEQLIDNCRGLPPEASRPALRRLHCLANDVLPFNKERAHLPADFERELLSLLNVLRALIEGAPSAEPGTVQSGRPGTQ